MTVRRYHLRVVAVALAVAFAWPSPSYAFLDKTRFAAHLGVAYFSFHHFVLKPFQSGAFANGAPHRISTLAKGGVALLFAVHEVKVAEKIAGTSNDPLLHKLDGGLTSLASSFAGVGSALKAGKFKPDDVSTLEGETTQVSSEAAADGAPIKDVPIAIPGT